MKWIADDGRAFSNIDKGRAYNEKLKKKRMKLEKFQQAVEITTSILQTTTSTTTKQPKIRKDKGIKRKKYVKVLPNKYQTYISRANAKKRKFDLSIEEFNNLLHQDCAYCGKSNAYTIDRIDSKRGYTKDNVLPACWICNMMKYTHSTEFFINHIKKIINYQENINSTNAISDD